MNWCNICECRFKGNAMEHIEEEHPEIGGKDAMMDFERDHIYEVDG